MARIPKNHGWLGPIFITIITISTILGCATKSQKVYHVGILSGLNYMADTADGFKSKMAELGYLEGKSIFYHIQKTEFSIAAYQKILKTFVAEEVDLIFVFPTEASIEAKAATQGTNIPVVFAIANTEDTNLVNSVREPGNNITGVRYPGPDIAIKRFEVMHELAPKAKRMLIPYQRNYPIVKSQLEAVKPVAAAAGVTLIENPAADAAELELQLGAREKSKDTGLDAILAIAEPLFVTPDAFVVAAKFAARHKIPIGGALISVDKYESLYGVYINNVTVGKQAAFLADKILKGTPAGTIPVVSAENYFQLNYRAAKASGLKVNEGLLSRANEVIR